MISLKTLSTALQVKLTQGQVALVGWGTDNLEAYLKMMNGLHHYFRFNKHDNETARRLFLEAIALDTNYANAYLLLAWTYCLEAQSRWTKTTAKSYQTVMELAKKVITLIFRYLG